MTKITNETYTPWAVTGSPERLLDRASNGTLWFAQNHDDDVYYWYSRDEGNTWSYSGSEIDALSSFFVRAHHLDNAGHMHSVGRVSNTQLRYYRGHPESRSWDFDGTGRQFTFSVANEALAPDSGLDMVAWSVADIYKVFVLFGTTVLSGGTYTNTLRLAEISISASRVVTLTKTSVIRTATGDSMPYGSLTFKHTGDGKTPSATPHLYVVSSVNTQNTASARQDDLQLTKFTYESGIYTQGSPVVLEAAVDTTGRTMRCSYDGDRVVTVYGTRTFSAGATSGAVHEVDWTESSGAVTRNDPPAYGGGFPTGVSSAVDPVTDDIYVVAYGSTQTTPVWSRYSRTAAAWSAWTQFGASLAGWTRTSRISLKQYVQKSAIEAVYTTGSGSPWQVHYTKITVTNTAPSVPQLLAPAPSSIADLGTQGATFSWRFVDPDPGDLQGGWQMRRRIGSGAYSYYTAATQSWASTTAVWNTGSDTQVSFPAGVWANGNVWAWSVNTRDSAGLPSGFAPDAAVTATLSPAVTVTGPLGIYAIDSSPIVSWTYASANPQRTYQVRVFDLPTYTAAGFDPAASVPLWDSGDVPSVQARAIRIGIALLNGAAYRSYMRVSDANGLYSGWVYGEFVLSLNPGPTPTVQAVVENDYFSGLGRVRLTIQGIANMLTANQAYDHSNNAEWEATNCAIANSPNGAVAQTLLSLRLTSSGSGVMSARTFAGTPVLDTTGAVPPTPRDFPARPGQTYTGLASFTAATTPRNVRVTLSWWGPGVLPSDPDVAKGTTTGTFLADMVGFPVQATVTGVCPLGADRVRLTVEVLGVTAAGEVHYVDGIDLHPGTSTSYSAGGLVSTQTFSAFRQLPDGSSTVVRTANQTYGDQYQRLVVYDREMPFATPVTYSVQGVIQLTTGQTLASDPSVGAQAQVDSAVWGVRDPVDPTGESVALVTGFEIERNALTTVYRPAGRVLPLVESQGSTGDDATKMTVETFNVADRLKIRNILNRQTELFLQSPSGESWYIWITQQKPVSGNGLAQAIDVTYVEVDAP